MTPEQFLELDFLRFFYESVYDVIGPAVDDIYEDIKAEWVSATGEQLPDGY